MHRGIYLIRKLYLIFSILYIVGGANQVFAQEKTSPSHPRLYFNKEKIRKLKNRASDPYIDSLIVKPLLKEAKKEEILLKFPEKSMLNTCLAYVLTGKKYYLNIALKKLEKVVNTPGDWTIPPYKYTSLKYMNIDAARKAYAIAMAYDILYDQIPHDLKKKSLDVLSKKVFNNYLKAFSGYDYKRKLYTDDNGHIEWWTRCYFAWNSKVNGMIGVAALATLNEIPESKEVLKVARYALKQSHQEYTQPNHDGGYKDGPFYQISYLMYAIRFYAALENCKYTDDGFFDLPGIKNSLDFISDFTAPDSTFAPYGYTPRTRFINKYDELYGLVRNNCKAEKLNFLDNHLLYGGNLPFALLWRPCRSKEAPITHKDKLKHYQSNDWAFANDQRLFVTVRGGDNAIRKNHPEAGEIKVWLSETFLVGPGDYLNPASENKNTLVFNDKGQINPTEKLFFAGDSSKYYGDIKVCETIQDNEYIKIDLTHCYEGIQQYHRHVLITNTGSLVVFDDAIADKATTISQNWSVSQPLDEDKSGSVCIRGKKRALHVRTFANTPITRTLETANEYPLIKISTVTNIKPFRIINVFSPYALNNPEVYTQFHDKDVMVLIKTKKGLDKYQFVSTSSGFIFKNQLK